MSAPSPVQVAGWIEALFSLGPVGIECRRLPGPYALSAALWRGQLSRTGESISLDQCDEVLLQIRPLGETDCYAWQRLSALLPGQPRPLRASAARELVCFAEARRGLIACVRCPARCASSLRWLQGKAASQPCVAAAATPSAQLPATVSTCAGLDHG